MRVLSADQTPVSPTLSVWLPSPQRPKEEHPAAGLATARLRLVSLLDQDQAALSDRAGQLVTTADAVRARKSHSDVSFAVGAAPVALRLTESRLRLVELLERDALAEVLPAAARDYDLGPSGADRGETARVLHGVVLTRQVANRLIAAGVVLILLAMAIAWLG